MEYNDGWGHLDFYDRKDKYEQIASEFSEGDENLRNVLLIYGIII